MLHAAVWQPPKQCQGAGMCGTATRAWAIAGPWLGTCNDSCQRGKNVREVHEQDPCHHAGQSAVADLSFPPFHNFPPRRLHRRHLHHRVSFALCCCCLGRMLTAVSSSVPTNPMSLF
jgi:hypothetical protein